MNTSQGTIWVGVYDSERYHASDELAQALAKKLRTQVLIYGLWGTVNEAQLTVYDGDAVVEETSDWSVTSRRVSRGSHLGRSTTIN